MEWAISCVLGSRWDLEGRAEELAVLGGSNKKEAKAGLPGWDSGTGLPREDPASSAFLEAAGGACKADRAGGHPRQRVQGRAGCTQSREGLSFTS